MGDGMRPSGRAWNEMRRVTFETGVSRHAEGSCLVSIGDTRVLCTATVEERGPSFLRGTGLGWVTAEYAMLPRATTTRTRREAVVGRQVGRTLEIQRLIGRSLRAAVDRQALGERQIVIDCDVLQADGGTRCAAITGGWVALRIAVERLLASGALRIDPLSEPVAAVSVGLHAGAAVLDLDYAEDSQAGVDGNFVMLGADRLVEVQVTAEAAAFAPGDLDAMLTLARRGASTLGELQREAVACAGT